MKKRIEIRQDWKRGFGSAPTGIKNWVKWSLVGFVVYVAVRFVCAFWVVFCPCRQFWRWWFPHPCRVAHSLRACPFYPCSLRDTLTEYESF